MNELSDGRDANILPPPGYDLLPCPSCGTDLNERCVVRSGPHKGEPASRRHRGRRLTSQPWAASPLVVAAEHEPIRLDGTPGPELPTVAEDLEWLRSATNQMPARMARVLRAFDESAELRRRYDKLRAELAGMITDQGLAP